MQVEVNLTEEQRQAMLVQLRNSYQMYERTKKQSEKIRKSKKDERGNRVYSESSIQDTLDLMNTMQKDIRDKYVQLGGDEKDLKKKIEEPKKKKGGLFRPWNQSEDENTEQEQSSNEGEVKQNTWQSYIQEAAKNFGKAETKKEKAEVKEEPVAKEEEKLEPTEVQTIGSASNPKTEGNRNYDLVPLPSRGQCYKDKRDSLRVAYLTAYDENIIFSPNLYRDGTFLDEILSHKILDDVNPDDLVQGDRDAIIIWLRTGYGNEYPVDYTDENGKVTQTTIDLSKIKYKEFNLKGDENGYFDYTVKSTGDKIKFKFLTNADIKKLDKIKENEEKDILLLNFRSKLSEIATYLEDNDWLPEDKSRALENAIEGIEDKIAEKEEEIKNKNFFSHDITNRILASIVSINNIKDSQFIADYVVNMNVKDASDFRRYILNNEPGVDYNVRVKVPGSPGGGYVNTFLQLDQFIFVNSL